MINVYFHESLVLVFMVPDIFGWVLSYLQFLPFSVLEVKKARASELRLAMNLHLLGSVSYVLDHRNGSLHLALPMLRVV